MQIKYPYQIDGNGQTADSEYQAHVKEMLEQLLFTMPGERVNRPDFGCGLMQLVFAPNSSELATTTQFLVQGAIQQWLGDFVRCEDVQVVAEDATLTVTVQYIILKDQTRVTEEFSVSN